MLRQAIFINCEHHTGRRRWMEHSIARIGLLASRYQAVLPQSTEAEIVLERLGAAGTIISLQGNELACFLSHYDVWSLVAVGEEEHVLVLEDDVIFAGNLPELLSDPRLLAGEPDIVRLEAWQGDGIVSRNFERLGSLGRLHRHKDISGGAAAYILSRTGARKLTGKLGAVDMAVDLLLFRQDSALANKLFTQVVLPCPAIQHDTLQRKRRNKLTKAWSTVQFQPELESQRGVWYVPERKDDVPSGESTPSVKCSGTTTDTLSSLVPATWAKTRRQLRKELSNLMREVQCRLNGTNVTYFGISSSAPIVPDDVFDQPPVDVAATGNT